MIDKVMDFVDYYSLDDRLYWRVTGLYDKKTYEVMWKRVPDKKNWSISLLKENEWTTLDQKYFLRYLKENHINLLEFESQIRNDLITQAVYANDFLKKAEELLGRETIDIGKRNFVKFQEKLAILIKNVTNKNPKPNKVFKIVK